MISALVVSPNPSVPGGVSVFIECMKRHVSNSNVESFYIGSSGRGGASPFQTLKRLIVGPIELARRVRARKYDVVHINPSFDVKSLIRDGLFVLALRAVGFRRVLFYFHGWDLGVQQRITRSWLLRRVTAWVLNQAALITVLGNDFRDGLIAIGVLPSRVEITHTMFEGVGLTAAQAEPVGVARRFILFMSRFDHEKGGRELVQAFAALLSDYPDVDLIMAGSGEDDIYLRDKARRLSLAGRIVFTGYIGGADKWRLLRDCTIFALPTYYRSEGMPVSILEAMGAGKALLAGSAGALNSIISDPENGVVLQKVSAQSVEVGLRRLLSQPDDMVVIGKRNHEIAWQKFEAHAVTAEIENLYQRVAQC
jgi:glycosyltransferase involved in cell wall biosynthesis